MKIFGRRSINENRYIVPPKAWAEPDAARFFERINARPNDPDNIRVSHADVVRMKDEGLTTLGLHIAELKRGFEAKGFGAIDFRPFWLIAERCWNGSIGDFLIYHLRLNPYEKWNSIILPIDLANARKVKVPVHPCADVPAFAETCEEYIINFRSELITARDEAVRTCNFGKFQDEVEGAITKVKVLAECTRKEIARLHAASDDGIWYKAQ